MNVIIESHEGRDFPFIQPKDRLLFLKRTMSKIRKNLQLKSHDCIILKCSFRLRVNEELIEGFHKATIKTG